MRVCALKYLDGKRVRLNLTNQSGAIGITKPIDRFDCSMLKAPIEVFVYAGNGEFVDDVWNEYEVKEVFGDFLGYWERVTIKAI